ncbi:MAG: hypothetical protein ABFD92_09285 [Planctomycetaceae bacterium]|nr:hypothetical protein [Planctomycetaceae bacterium]
MRLTTDWHIHSVASCDCRSTGMSVAEIVAGAAAQGITDFGLTDHLHTRLNLPDLRLSREAFLACDPSPRFHFGVEATCLRQWEVDEIAAGRVTGDYGAGDVGPGGGALAIDLTAADVEELGIEYVIGAAHGAKGTAKERWPIIEAHFRQYLFLAAHPLVDILAHPWWWSSGFANADGSFSTLPWFDDFRVIPRTMHEELAAALVQTGTAAEINPGVALTWHYPAAWKQQYIEYMAWLKSRGVKLATGSDRHLRPYDSRYSELAPLLESVGIRDEDLWRLPPRA